jgi:centrosomal protein CEP41
MRRDQNHPDFYRFRNKADMLIIVYCDDERVSRDAAKLMVDRGTDNIFLLTGGLMEFAAEYPGFIEGEPPVAPRTSTKRPVARSGAHYLSIYLCLPSVPQFTL